MIDISGVTKNFGGFVALKDVSLSIAQGELVALLGPSGSGKTTLLRIIAGLEFPEQGKIRFGGSDATRLAARERQVGFVFQHYALFRHMTVFDNVAFGLRVRKRRVRPSEKVIAAKVEELLKLVQLDGLAGRYPQQLSGGQRQRVALARALAIEPRVLLLDEPFGALDAQVRKDLRRWLRRLHDEIGVTGVFVTHDQEEALEVADRVVVMNQGCIEQIGTPTEIYDNPATPFVYQFLGNVNSLPCRVRKGRAEFGSFQLKTPDGAGADGRGVAFVRPHDLAILPLPADQGRGGFKAVVRHLVVLGPLVRVELVAEGERYLEAEITRQRHAELNLAPGMSVFVSPRKARLFVHEGWEGAPLAAIQ